jgi:hypothetical protein
MAMMTRLVVLVLGSGLPAWVGWSFGSGAGILEGFLCANVGFAIGWYYSRKFVREHLDL